MALCPGCGNEVADPQRCPVCKAGRAIPKHRKPRAEEQVCPRCSVNLEPQDMDGSRAFMCPDCRGIFFPEYALEAVLNKLRDACETMDTQAVLQEFKDRFTRKLPETVRYKNCPVCRTVMTPSNYQTVSGVIVDVCGQHGTWVDEHAFAELANFIVRGGDFVANASRQVRARTHRTRSTDSGPNLLDRFFGAH